MRSLGRENLAGVMIAGLSDSVSVGEFFGGGDQAIEKRGPALLEGVRGNHEAKRRHRDALPITDGRRQAGGETVGKRRRHAFSLTPRARDILVPFVCGTRNAVPAAIPD
jgi:hypothetical protein